MSHKSHPKRLLRMTPGTSDPFAKIEKSTSPQEKSFNKRAEPPSTRGPFIITREQREGEPHHPPDQTTLYLSYSFTGGEDSKRRMSFSVSESSSSRRQIRRRHRHVTIIKSAIALGLFCLATRASAFSTPIPQISTRNSLFSTYGHVSKKAPRSCAASSSSALNLGLRSLYTKMTGGIELSGLLYDSTSTAFDAWEWTANLGAPAALVAGSVLVTLSETRPSLAPKKTDVQWVRAAKQLCRLLLLSSFALEVVSIFVGTVTGSVLLGHSEQTVAKKMIGYGSPLALVHHHHELNYLTINIGFLQGLFNWLGAVVLEILIPRQEDSASAKRMNQCLASCLVSLMLWITAFYNNHLNFYVDYAHMLKRYGVLFWREYISWQRPLAFFYIPSFLFSVFLAWRAFKSPPELDPEE